MCENETTFTQKPASAPSSSYLNTDSSTLITRTLSFTDKHDNHRCRRTGRPHEDTKLRRTVRW